GGYAGHDRDHDHGERPAGEPVPQEGGIAPEYEQPDEAARAGHGGRTERTGAELVGEILGPLAPGVPAQEDGGEVRADEHGHDAAEHRGGVQPARDDVPAGDAGGNPPRRDPADDRAEEEGGGEG